MSLSINPNIAKAKTLGTDFYLQRHFYESSKEKIFAKTWQFIGDTDLVKEPGWVTPVNFLEKFMDEPLLLSHDKQGKLNCLSNVCTHRGNLVVEKACKLNDIRCKYHGRRFQLDGKFLSMPEFKEVEDFPSEADNLTKVPLFQWDKLLFTTLNSSIKSEDFFSDMMKRVSWMPLHDFHFRPEHSRDYLIEANWALYCENYLEGFHIPFVHSSLNAMIDYSNYIVEIFKYSSLQIGAAKNVDYVFDIPSSSKDHGKKIGAYYFWVFPNMMFNFYPWGLSINVIRPVGVSKTRVSFLSYVWDENKLRQGAGADLHTVEMEDQDIVQNVQKGIRSRFYKHGRYSVTRESGTHHFHRLIAEFMT